MAEDDTPERESLLPYDRWTNEASRLVILRALQFAAAEGLPGDHHFYITFRTDHPGVVMPERVRAKYPEEITIVLQHQFRNLAVDEAGDRFSVTLDFGGVPAQLGVPFEAVSTFVDPAVQVGLRCEVEMEEAQPEAPPEPQPEARPEPPRLQIVTEPEPPSGEAEVVSLDAFRRRTPPKE
ncbi:MAG TPA: ClpXP protease specificity-enhancing factor SspB [Acetobacteraceae bacterium]|nr:ClpXP protease specificity-enhancing factor SspB [Acetobacteraceae bacterium]